MTKHARRNGKAAFHRHWWSVLVGIGLLAPTLGQAQTCAQVNALLSEGIRESDVARGVGMSSGNVRACARQLRGNRYASPAGPPAVGAAGRAPIGAARRSPRGAAGPAPFGAAGPGPSGMMGR